ncbi:hypothetical protein Agub_g1634 [Astrephomene gubernaculifera]|uniref:Uncharacterized protein n=1 Tax=Astrephomene gubernaculifera TaxID=47775 RepID=A0AAD3HHW7_9CHLO|nr:hypothetical protein Agub_g1634 [Astrephomene gubernaculifera]
MPVSGWWAVVAEMGRREKEGLRIACAVAVDVRVLVVSWALRAAGPVVLAGVPSSFTVARQAGEDKGCATLAAPRWLVLLASSRTTERACVREHTGTSIALFFFSLKD